MGTIEKAEIQARFAGAVFRLSGDQIAHVPVVAGGAADGVDIGGHTGMGGQDMNTNRVMHHSIDGGDASPATLLQGSGDDASGCTVAGAKLNTFLRIVVQDTVVDTAHGGGGEQE